ncbi:hypothetical protein ED733_006407 [Metarhizium rileyi]|uniref:Mating-type switching protein swi10 n=1 Tax=Metarhizium rileyi (strain RCEF 4871) TaxID=1649241 RepID=A0A5C6GFN1_METRR|nr:hypothetical protein ED733_006407 [Metarhizium rileyi]
MSFQYSVSPISSEDSFPPTSTKSRHSRRSLVMMANSLKPTRQKLHKYFTMSRHSVPESDFKDWNATELSSALKRASMQMGCLANPEIPISPVVQDLRYKPSRASAIIDDKTSYKSTHDQKSELHYEPEPFVFDSFLAPPQNPPPVRPQQIPHPSPPSSQIPQPDRIPPPPPIPEFSQPEDLPSLSEPPSSGFRRGPSTRRPRPVSGIRRRAKTPVHKIGQLEMAAAKKRQEAAINRQSSIRTIARQYRALIYETEIPSIHRKPLPHAALPCLHEFDDNHEPIPRQSISEPQAGDLLQLEETNPRHELTPSPESDADTLVSFGDAPLCVKPLRFSAPPMAPAEADEYEDDDYLKSPAAETSRFEIGFEMLTRELSTVFADHSARAGRDVSGLQIRVMIEAYERLRDQVSSMGTADPELQNARAVFDSWLSALRAVHQSIANEGAESDSEYGDEDDE